MFKVMRDPKAAVEFAKQQNRVLNQIRGNVQKDFYGKEAVAEAVERQQKPVTEAIERQSATIEQALPPIYSMLGKLAYRSGAELSTDELLSIFSDSAVANDLAVRGIVDQYIPTLVEGILSNKDIDDSLFYANENLREYIAADRVLSEEKKAFAANLAERKLLDLNTKIDSETSEIGAREVYNSLLNEAAELFKAGELSIDDIYNGTLDKYENVIKAVLNNKLMAFINPVMLMNSRHGFELTLGGILTEGKKEIPLDTGDIIAEEYYPITPPSPAEEKPVEPKLKSNIITLDQLLAEKPTEDASKNIIKVLSTGQTATVEQSATVEGGKEPEKKPMGPGKVLQKIEESGKEVGEEGYRTRWDYTFREIKTGDKSYYELVRDEVSPSFAFNGYNNAALNYINPNGNLVPVTNNNINTKFPEGVLTSPGLKVLLAGKLSKSKTNNKEVKVVNSNKAMIKPSDVAAYYVLANTEFDGGKEHKLKIARPPGVGAKSLKSKMGTLESIRDVVEIVEGLNKQSELPEFIEGVIKTLILSKNKIGTDKAAELIKGYSNWNIADIKTEVRQKSIADLKKLQSGGKLTKKGFKAPPNYLKKAKMNAKQPPNPGKKVFSSPQEVARRAQVLIAAIDAGNNSPWIREELSQLYDMLRTTGQISQSEYKRLQTALMK